MQPLLGHAFLQIGEIRLRMSSTLFPKVTFVLTLVAIMQYLFNKKIGINQ